MKKFLLSKGLCLFILVTVAFGLNAQVAPKVYYNFDETSGTTITDRSGNNHHGTVGGIVEFVTGKYRGAIRFPNVTDTAVVVMPAANIQLTNVTGTVAFWMITPLGNQINIMWWAGNGTDRLDSFGEWAMHLHYERTEAASWLGGELAFWAAVPSGNLFLHSDPKKFTADATNQGGLPVEPTLVADSVWHHVALVWGDGSDAVMYIDGVKISSWAYTPKPGLDLVKMNIGKALTGVNRVYRGIMDEFRLYDVALTAADIAALYALDPTISGLEDSKAKFAIAIGPNPFNNNVNIRYQLHKNSDVLVDIYNLTGQKVRTLVQENQVAGLQTINWDGSNDSGLLLNSGNYLCRIQIDGNAQTRVLTMVR
ncbi:MAG: LamG-like jellyroll fold domain-containing protein [Bacteroidales bacterium]